MGLTTAAIVGIGVGCAAVGAGIGGGAAHYYNYRQKENERKQREAYFEALKENIENMRGRRVRTRLSSYY